MVKGLDVFASHFRNQKNKYVLIGGAACDIAMSETGLDFRATRDLDIVLILEALDDEFSRVFWDFVRKGNYKNRQKSTGKKLFYRFYDPEDDSYPSMLELFSRTPDLLKNITEEHLSPVPFGDEVSSLSAILLDDDYYEFIREGIIDVTDVPVLSPLYLIPLKAKAFLDLNEKRTSGLTVDKRDISKHRNDVLRLYQIFTPESAVLLPDSIKEDMKMFIDIISVQDIQLKSLDLRKGTLKDVLNNLMKIYGLD